MYIKRKQKTPEEIEAERAEKEKMWNFFNTLWAKLPKNKECWNCGNAIWGENLSIYWDHLIEKEPHPELKYEEENMFFCCSNCHRNKGDGFPGEKHKKAIIEAKNKFLYAKSNKTEESIKVDKRTGETT